MSAFAGVLPFCVKPNGNVVFLLGRENGEGDWQDSGKYSDFGGTPEHSHVIKSASIELYEETMGLLGSKKDLFIAVSTKALRVNTGPKSVVFLLKIPFIPSLPKVFDNIAGYHFACAKRVHGKLMNPSCPKGWLEKDKIKWISAEKLAEAVETGAKTYRSAFLASIPKVLIHLRRMQHLQEHAFM